MQIKYKENWPEVIESAKSHSLDFENTITLLGLMELDDDGGNELYKLESRGLNVKGKSEVYAKWLRTKDYHYQNYLKRLSIDDEPFEFIEYAFGDNPKLKEYINIINKEFTTDNNDDYTSEKNILKRIKEGCELDNIKYKKETA